VGIFPFSVHYSERDVFIGRPGTEVEQHSLFVPWFLYNFVRGRLGLVDEIWIEYVELVCWLGYKYDKYPQ
jgi:hypothetical protein